MIARAASIVARSGPLWSCASIGPRYNEQSDGVVGDGGGGGEGEGGDAGVGDGGDVGRGDGDAAPWRREGHGRANRTARSENTPSVPMTRHSDPDATQG